MSVMIIRSRKPFGGGFSFSEDARRRAREYLKSAGIRVEQLPPLIWPDDAVSAYKEHMYAPWQYTTQADIRRKRQKRAKEILWFKREYGVSRRRALYVWVFWCPGVSGVFFRGWWTYLIGKNVSYAPNFRNNDKETMIRLIRLFPLVEPTLFGLPDWEKWMMEFVKHYQRGRWCGKPQGKVPIWAEIKGNGVKRILGRAEWPKEK